MIKQDLVSYPEFRQGYFLLVQHIIKYCTQAFFNLQHDRFQTLVYTIIFAMQHEKPELMELGLETMDSLWHILNTNSDKKTPFYVNFYTMILHETIKVLTDYKHMSGFKLQATILSKLI
jgi:exportin-1